MAWKRLAAALTVTKLRQIEMLQAQGKTIAVAQKKLDFYCASRVASASVRTYAIYRLQEVLLDLTELEFCESESQIRRV